MSTLFLGTIAVASVILFSGATLAVNEMDNQPIFQNAPLLVPEGNSLLARNELSSRRSVAVVITGYSSTKDQTDDTPFITAWNTKVRPGVVAANWLPLGTKVRIPELFGKRVFTVEDRMHPRNDEKLDVWFQSREEALEFGVREARVEVL